MTEIGPSWSSSAPGPGPGGGLAHTRRPSAPQRSVLQHCRRPCPPAQRSRYPRHPLQLAAAGRADSTLGARHSRVAMSSFGTTRTDIKNAAMFGGRGADAAGGGSAVWVGHGVTRTKPSRTLFVAAIPRGVEHGQVQQLFSLERGYDSFRSRRGMCFVDFDTIENGEWHVCEWRMCTQRARVCGCT